MLKDSMLHRKCTVEAQLSVYPLQVHIGAAEADGCGGGATGGAADTPPVRLCAPDDGGLSGAERTPRECSRL